MLLTGLQSFLLKPCKSLNTGPKNIKMELKVGPWSQWDFIDVSFEASQGLTRISSKPSPKYVIHYHKYSQLSITPWANVYIYKLIKVSNKQSWTFFFCLEKQTMIWFSLLWYFIRFYFIVIFFSFIPKKIEVKIQCNFLLWIHLCLCKFCLCASCATGSSKSKFLMPIHPYFSGLFVGYPLANVQI